MGSVKGRNVGQRDDEMVTIGWELKMSGVL